MTDSIPTASGHTPSHLERLRQAWNRSLRFRLLALGLAPLLIAFPIVVAVVVLVGGERATSLQFSFLRANLAGTRSYLDQVKTDTGVRVGELVKSDRLIQSLRNKADRPEIDQVLKTAARGSGLDFLVVARSDGTVIGASTPIPAGVRLPDSHVVRQARIGLASAAYERFEGEQLAAFSPEFRNEAKVELSPKPSGGRAAETRGLMINAAAHFPLAANDTDAILVGGILLNKNFALIEHLREIIFPVGVLPGDTEGLTGIFVDDVSVAVSRQKHQGQGIVGTRSGSEVASKVLGAGEVWLGLREVGGESHMAGYESISDGDGRRVGMIAVAFPDAPYRKTIVLILVMISGLMALTMLAISLVFLRTGRQLTQRLDAISETMTRVRQGKHDARVGRPMREDELGQLSRDFDMLLDTIASQDEIRRATLRAVADEASRRRALFEHERDGVVILNPDGSVFEANPKGIAMLGYDQAEFGTLHLSDWDTKFTAADLERTLAGAGPEGLFFETLHRRKDGSQYPAEVAVSHARWGHKSFLLVLQRDITERKAAETELAEYRLNLEQLVDQRTKELNDRSEQLNAIFALSPDGFVSFDSNRRVSFANSAFVLMTGIAAADIVSLDEQEFSGLLARKCLANARFPDLGTLRAARRKVIDEGDAAKSEPARRLLIELSGPGNRILEVRIRISEAENVSQILYFRDITHEMEVDRMKSEFLSTAAHELRTPMASIYGYSELLLTQDFGEDGRKEMLSTIFRQSELMASIINELLDLARIESRRGKDFVIERASLQELLTEAVVGYKPPPGRSRPIVAETAEPLHVNVDRKKIQQALLNILSNAYKYSPRGGDVRIACLEADSGGRVGVEVRDPGIGMSPEEQSRVFERFYRADDSGKTPGTGLGMSIVKEIVELHGGEVQLESITGRGTTVTLRIPAA